MGHKLSKEEVDALDEAKSDGEKAASNRDVGFSSRVVKSSFHSHGSCKKRH